MDDLTLNTLIGIECRLARIATALERRRSPAELPANMEYAPPCGECGCTTNLRPIDRGPKPNPIFCPHCGDVIT